MPRKGDVQPESSKEKISNALTGRHLSEETKRKMSDARKAMISNGFQTPFTKPDYVPWNKGLTKDTDSRVSDNANEISKSTKGKSPSPIKLEHLRRISPLGISSVKNKWTDIEVAVYDYLKSRIPYDILSHKYLDHICNVDFVIPDIKLAVFADGCYWHGCPKDNGGDYILPIYKSGRKSGKSIQDVRDKDKQNVIELSNLGWNVVRIWKHEVKAGDFSKFDSLIHKS